MKSPLSRLSLIIGIICFITVVLHAKFGPIEEPGLSSLAAHTAHRFERSLAATMSGKKHRHKPAPISGPDRALDGIATAAALAGLVLGLAGFVKREDGRYCTAAMVINGTAVMLLLLV
jgi:hypothetical protein